MRAALSHAMPIELRRLLALVSTSALAALLLVAAVMVIRRAAVSLESVSPWFQLLAGVLTVAGAVALRELARLAAEPRAWWRPAISIMAAAVMLLTALAVTLEPASAAAVALVWLAIVGEEAYHWRSILADRRHTLPRLSNVLQRPAAADKTMASSPLAGGVLAEDSTEPESEELLPAEVLQQLTRSRSESGGEVIYALLRAEFAVGDRQQWLSVAFCPPMPLRPACSAHLAEGGEGMLEVEEVETYGVRLVVRLPRTAAMEQSVLVELFAESAARD